MNFSSSTVHVTSEKSQFPNLENGAGADNTTL